VRYPENHSVVVVGARVARRERVALVTRPFSILRFSMQTRLSRSLAASCAAVLALAALVLGPSTSHAQITFTTNKPAQQLSGMSGQFNFMPMMMGGGMGGMGGMMGGMGGMMGGMGGMMGGGMMGMMGGGMMGMSGGMMGMGGGMMGMGGGMMGMSGGMMGMMGGMGGMMGGGMMGGMGGMMGMMGGMGGKGMGFNGGYGQ
jgi:hypothetical protein